MLTYNYYLFVLNWQSFKYQHILKDLHFLLSSPILFGFHVLFILYFHVYPLIVYCSYSFFFYNFFFCLCLHTGLFKWLFLSPYYIFAFHSEIFSLFYSFFCPLRPCNVSFRVGLVLMNSFSFCFLRSSLSLLRF